MELNLIDDLEWDIRQARHDLAVAIRYKRKDAWVLVDFLTRKERQLTYERARLHASNVA
jgi:hypothetical protein